MTLISLLMNVFRNTNDRAFCKDLACATMKDIMKIEVKYGEKAISGLTENQIFSVFGYDFREMDAVLSKNGIHLIPDGRGWKVQGFCKNPYGFGTMPLGCCFETFSSKGDALAAIADVIDQSRLKPIFDEEVNNILDGDLLTAISLFL